MTMDIANMPAGREMDALVAEKVMGIDPVIICGQYGAIDGVRTAKPCDHVLGRWEFKGICPQCGWRGIVGKTPPQYSTDIAAAMKIPKRMSELGKDLDFSRELAKLVSIDGYLKIPGQLIWNMFYGLEAMPLLICRAALLAMKGA